LGGSFEDARHLWVLIGMLGSFGEEESWWNDDIYDIFSSSQNKQPLLCQLLT
jgi:hypothetical protein